MKLIAIARYEKVEPRRDWMGGVAERYYPCASFVDATGKSYETAEVNVPSVMQIGDVAQVGYAGTHYAIFPATAEQVAEFNMFAAGADAEPATVGGA